MKATAPPQGRPTERSAAPGVIDAAALYTLAELSARTGLGRWAMRQARNAGLRVLRTGGRSFIRGADFIQFLEESGK